MKKRIFSFFLTICMVSALVMVSSITANAATEYTSGYYTYTINNGKATITGCNTAISGKISIPSTLGGCTVTTIDVRAFDNCRKLTGVTLGNSVVTIGNCAFSDCTSLTSITIGDSVTTIGDSAFYSTAYYNDNTNWENDVLYIGNYLIEAKRTLSGDYIIKNGTKCIADSAFSNCTSLTSITIPDSVTSIGAFSLHCGKLTNIEVSSNNSVFSSLNGNLFNKKQTTLIQYAIGKPETAYTIPSTVTSIGDYAFRSGKNLESIFMPNTVTNIGNGAFEHCVMLSDIILPNSIINIGDSAFALCRSLTSITIPNGVITIGAAAFSNCPNLTKVSLPDSVTSIGSNAFRWCESLTSIKLPNNVTEIGTEMFFYCYSLNNVILGNNIQTIGWGAFEYCGSLTDIIIPNSVTEIGPYAFQDCGLKTLTIGNNVSTIQTEAFWGCINLKNVYYQGNKSNWANIDIDAGNELLTSATIHYNYSTSPVSVKTVTLNTDYLTMKVGDKNQLQANCTPNNATDKSLTWSSDNTKVATVNSNGVVTACGVGVANITAKSKNGKSATCTITVQAQNVIDYDDFRYDFDNSNDSFGYWPWYKIPMERYMQLGLKEEKAKEIVRNSATWGGNCFGMSTSSILFYKNVLQEENYDKKVNVPIEFDKPNSIINSMNSIMIDTQDIKLGQMIELFQISQVVLEDSAQPKFSAINIAHELDNGNPVKFGMKEENGGGHAVVIYGYEKTGNSYKFYIYDCSNYVSGLNYVDENNWSFDYIDDAYVDDAYVWKPNNYCTYSTIKDIYAYLKTNNYNNAASLFSLQQEPSYTYIFRPKEDITITNSLGQISKIIDSEITGQIEDVRIINSSYLAEEPTYTIILPTDTYTIVGNGEDIITTSFADDYMSASVTAKSSTPITISSDLKEVSVDTTTGEKYDITYTTYDNIFDVMNLSGIATGTVTSKLNDADVLVTGVNTLTASASVSDSVVSANLDSLSNSDEITVKCEEADGVATIQILNADAELTDKTSLPERLTVDTPAYDLASGTYTEGQVLNFTKDDDTIIYYTIDGSIPSADNGIIYSLPIDINKSMTVKAIATKYGYLDSDVITLEYTLPEVSAPVLNYISGEYNTVLSLELTSDDPANEIYYTLDGSDPFENGILYTVPIHLFENTTVKAYTLQNGCVSDICEYDYTITHQLPFYFENTALNQNYELITLDNLSALTEVTLSVTKLLDGEQTGAFSVAFYDENDKLISVSQAEATITQNNETVRIPITANTSGAKKMKVFVWDSALKPLGEIQAHKFSKTEQ